MNRRQKINKKWFTVGYNKAGYSLGVTSGRAKIGGDVARVKYVRMRTLNRSY